MNAGFQVVLDADIKGFFDNIDHVKLLEFVHRRISDRRIIKLIRKWLRCGVMDGGVAKETIVGAPQGGVISPLLANIYLHEFDKFWEQQKGTIFGMLDLFTGRGMSRMTIFALGIMPYISASIILQLLQVVWPYLERLSKEGELGRKKITQYTRYGTLVICAIQSFGISLFLEKATSPGGLPIVPNPGWGFKLLTILTLTSFTIPGELSEQVP